MAEVLTGDRIRAIELPVGGDILMSDFLARPWTTSSGRVCLVAISDSFLTFMLVSQVIVSLIRLAGTAANPDLRRWLTADASRIPINVDVAIAVGRYVIVDLNGTQINRKLWSPTGIFRLSSYFIGRENQREM